MSIQNKTFKVIMDIILVKDIIMLMEKQDYLLLEKEKPLQMVIIKEEKINKL